MIRIVLNRQATNCCGHRLRRRRRITRLQRTARRAFNLVELLIALAITSALMAATMVALDASFFAYQRTTEVASTHTISRMAMHRMLSMVRTGTNFGPYPINPNVATVESDYIEFDTASGDIMALVWVSDPRQPAYSASDYPSTEALYLVRNPDAPGEEIFLLLEGVIQRSDPLDDPTPPFTLEYEKGRKLYRATIDLTIQPDDNMDLEIEGDNQDLIRLVASAMPRSSAY